MPDCEKGTYKRGWCRMHYARWQKYRDPTVVHKRVIYRKSMAERFWPKVEKSLGCWVWTGSKNRDGYGIFYRVIGPGEHGHLAHRVAYELHYGSPPPKGRVLHHTCGTRACVKLAHLELLSHQLHVLRFHRLCTETPFSNRLVVQQ